MTWRSSGTPPKIVLVGDMVRIVRELRDVSLLT